MFPYSKKIVFIFVIIIFGARCFSFEKSKPHRRKKLALPAVTCSSERIKAVFGSHVSKNVAAKDATGVVIPLPENEDFCGVKLITERNNGLVLLSQYDSCFAIHQDKAVVIHLHVQLKGEEQWYRVNISCPLIRRHSARMISSQNALEAECNTHKDLRVDCGYQGIKSEDCYRLECCYDDHDDDCFYKLNSCSLDRHFVFTVTSADTGYSIPLSSLVIKDHPECVPAITTPDTSVFKIGLMQCGAEIKEEGDMLVSKLNVTDDMDSLFSLEVSCEYELSELKKSKDLHTLLLPTNPPPAVAFGNVEVQMKIARDSSFTSFFQEDELPVTLPLRENAHVEISFVQPPSDSMLSLRVRECSAYPENKNFVWNLLYDGCPNPLDDMQSSIPVDDQGKIAFHSQVRRFTVKTFTFLDPQTGHHSTDQVYFYCWVEICTENLECAQYCSITSSDKERQRREASYTSDNLNLISLGPLLVGQNDTDVKDNSCRKSQKMFQVTLYIFSGVGAALLLILLFVAYTHLRCPRRVQAVDVQIRT